MTSLTKYWCLVFPVLVIHLGDDGHLPPARNVQRWWGCNKPVQSCVTLEAAEVRFHHLL